MLNIWAATDGSFPFTTDSINYVVHEMKSQNNEKGSAIISQRKDNVTKCPFGAISSAQPKHNHIVF